MNHSTEDPLPDPSHPGWSRLSEAVDESPARVYCTCGRTAIFYLPGASGVKTVPWCGTSNLPPLPGSVAALAAQAERMGL